MPEGLKKILHIWIIITIIIAIAFVALILILRYGEKGETNMPFSIDKVTIISTTDAQDVEDKENRWNEKVIQNNDIYIDIVKNSEYTKKAIIDEVRLSDLKVIKEPQIGEITFYKPANSEVSTFENKEEYEISELAFKGNQETNIQDLKISNQGGRIAFRISNNNVGSYVSKDDAEINYDQLLSKLKISKDDISSTISFNLEIKLIDGKLFRAPLKLQVPTDDIISKGRTSSEVTDLEVVFKRIEN